MDADHKGSEQPQRGAEAEIELEVDALTSGHRKDRLPRLRKGGDEGFGGLGFWGGRAQEPKRSGLQPTRAIRASAVVRKHRSGRVTEADERVGEAGFIFTC